MKILKLMTRNPKTVCPNHTLAEAAKIMKRINTGVLPVTENGKIVGIITDRDITIRSVAEGHDPKQALVSQAMTKQTVFCYDDENIHEAGRAMLSEKVGRLPVLCRKNMTLAGIVSLADIIKQCGGKNLIQSRQSLLTKAKIALPAALALAAWGAYNNRDKIAQHIRDSKAA